MQWHDHTGRSDEPASEKRRIFHFERGDKRWRETLQLFLRQGEAAVQEEAFLKQRRFGSGHIAAYLRSRRTRKTLSTIR